MLALHRWFFIVSSILTLLVAILGPQPAYAQNFGVFKTPSKKTVLVNYTTLTAEDIGGRYLGEPLLLEKDGTPYVFVLAEDLSTWYRTDKSGWSSLGGRCTRLRRTKLTSSGPTIEAFCPESPSIYERSIASDTKWQKSDTSSGETQQPTLPHFVDPIVGVFRNARREIIVVDTNKMTVMNLKGGLVTDPSVTIVGGELAFVGLGGDNAVWFRTVSKPWISLGGKARSISSVMPTEDGSDLIISIPGSQPDTVARRTLKTEWVDVDPLADYPLQLTEMDGSPADPPGPVTEVDKYVDSFIDEWGDDVLKMKAVKNQAGFEALLPSLKMSFLETKLIQQFNKTDLRDVMTKLVVAYPRSRFSVGIAEATTSYLKTLSATDGARVRNAFSYVLKNLPDDPIAQQRSVVLELFSRIPGISSEFRNFILSTLKDQTLGVTPGSLDAVGVTFYPVMLGNALLGTRPSPNIARSGIAAAQAFPLGQDQKDQLSEALNNYLAYADENLVCSQGECQNRSAKGEPCTAATPCQLGLQCFGGKCVDFSGKGAQCGQNYPFCHPSLTCNSPSPGSVGTCVERAKLGGSCKDRACEYGLSCLKRIGICVDTAKEGEPCAGISKPCIDGDVLFCTGGYCRKRGTAGQGCSADAPCVSTLTCSSPTGGTCEAKRALSEKCSKAYPCQPGLTCFSSSGVVGTTDGGICVTTVGLGAPCGLNAFCDPSKGLFCGSKNVCRTPGVQDEYCAEDGECSPGFLCNNLACSVPRGNGFKCQKDAHCVDGFFCDGRSNSKTYHQCILKGGDGAPCPCLAGHTCTYQPGVFAEAKCTRDHNQGEQCGGPFGRCAGDLVCFGFGMSGLGTCTALGGVTSKCAKSGDWLSPYAGCAPGLFCNFLGRCEAGRPDGGDCWGTFGGPCAEGLSCYVEGPFGHCTASCPQINHETCANSDNFACRQVRYTWGKVRYECTRKLPFGAKCTSDVDNFDPPCQKELFCSPSLKTCQFRSKAGEPCQTNGTQPCMSNAWCNQGTCVCKWPGMCR